MSDKPRRRTVPRIQASKRRDGSDRPGLVGGMDQAQRQADQHRVEQQREVVEVDEAPADRFAEEGGGHDQFPPKASFQCR